MAGGKQLVPGWFSWSKTIHFGRQVGATPNGRKAGASVTHGANPTPGFRKDGALTAMSNSICAVQPGYGNTAPVQLELDPGMGRGEEAVQKIADYIMTLFSDDGKASPSRSASPPPPAAAVRQKSPPPWQ